MDNVWRGLRELHVWTATWSSTLMSGRLDAFFSLTLCHALVASILFAGALSYYAPVAASYNHPASLTGLLYWVLVLFLATLLTGLIQLVMRMVRVGSGELLQRYRRVGVLLANPEPLGAGEPRKSVNYTSNNNNNNNNDDDDDDDTDVASTSPLLPLGAGKIYSYTTPDVHTPPASSADNSSSNALSSWLQRLRGVTGPGNRQNNNNNDDDDDNNNNNNSVVACTPCDAGVMSRQSAGLSCAPCVQLHRNNNNTNNDNSSNNDDIIRLVAKNECRCPCLSHGDSISTRALLPSSSSSSSLSSPSVPSQNVVVVVDDNVELDARSLLSGLCTSGPGQPPAVHESVVVAVPRECNNNDNNNNNNDNDNDDNEGDSNDKKDVFSENRKKVVSVTIQSAHQRHHNANMSSNFHDHENVSSNAGAEDVPVPPRASRQGSSTERPSRRFSGVDQTEAQRSSAEAGARGSAEVARKSSGGAAGGKASADEAKKSSSGAGAQSGSAAEPRKSSAVKKSSTREMSIADRRSSTGQSRSGETRRSSGGVESRRSTGGLDESRRSSGGVEARRSSASEKVRRSSSYFDANGGQSRRSSGGEELRRRSSRGLEVSDEAARRSYAASAADTGGARSSYAAIGADGTGVQSSYDFTSARDSEPEVRRCCDRVPASPCPSCCRPGVRPRTCWCRCPSEIHDPELLDDCCGARDGRLLSLPGFPSSRPSCNSCFTPCRPLPPICSKTPDCEPRCRSVSFSFSLTKITLCYYKVYGINTFFLRPIFIWCQRFSLLVVVVVN